MPDPNSDDNASSQSTQPGDAHPNGLRAYALLSQFLADDHWYPQEIEGRHTYRAHYKGKHGDLRCYAQIRVDLQQFIFYAVAPIKTPEESRPAVAEFITRANYGMRIGNFELDYFDGEVRYKSSLDFEDEILSASLIRNAVYPAVQTLDSYLPGLMRVAFGAQTPFEAIEEIEK